MTGSRYAPGTEAWGLCKRCHLRFYLHELVFDGYMPGLRVCVDCYDDRQPQEFFIDVTDPVALWKPSPEDGPTSPVLTLTIGAGIFLSWTQATPRGGPIVDSYTVWRATSSDGGATFAAYIAIATFPVTYITDLAAFVENGAENYDNEGISNQTLEMTDSNLPAGDAFRYFVTANFNGGRQANSNILGAAPPNISTHDSVQSSGSLIAGTLAAILPPGGSAIEDIQSGGDFLGGSITAVDPLFFEVVLLLHMDGTNGATSFPDNSLINNTVTAHGTAAVTTTGPEFGTGALLLTANTDNITTPCPVGGPLDLSTTDFTIEFFLYPVDVEGPWEYLEIGQGSAYFDGGIMFYNPNTHGEIGVQMPFFTNGFNAPVTNPLIANVWQHIALCRTAGQFLLFVNGITTDPFPPVPDARAIIWPSGANNLMIGAGLWAASKAGNKVDEVRITRGARYSANFTPPTAPFPNS